MLKLLIWGLVGAAFLTGCTASRTVIIRDNRPAPVAKAPGQFEASRAHTRNGIRFYERGHYRKAIQQLELAIAEDPSNWEAHFYLAESYRELRDYDHCLTQYQQVRDLRHDDPSWVARTEFSIGLVFERRGEPERAREHYELALTAVPNYEPAMQGKARLVSKKNRDNDEDNHRGKGKRFNYKDKDD